MTLSTKLPISEKKIEKRKQEIKNNEMNMIFPLISYKIRTILKQLLHEYSKSTILYGELGLGQTLYT